jgi:hypothetical protein
VQSSKPSMKLQLVVFHVCDLNIIFLIVYKGDKDKGVEEMELLFGFDK